MQKKNERTLDLFWSKKTQDSIEYIDSKTCSRNDGTASKYISRVTQIPFKVHLIAAPWVTEVHLSKFCMFPAMNQ